jgi:hypothetical protein
MVARAVTHLEIASIWIDVSIREEHNSSAEITRHPVEDGVEITDHVRLGPDRLQIEGIVTNQPLELPLSHADGVTASDSSLELFVDRMRVQGSRSTTIEGEPTLGMLGLVPGVSQAASLLRGGLLGTTGVDVRSKRKFQMITPAQALGRDTKHATGLVFSDAFDRVAAVQAALRAAFEARRPVQIVTGLRVYESVVLVDLSIMRDASTAGSLRFGATAEAIRVVKSSTGLVGVPDPLNTRAKPAADLGNQNTAPVDDVPLPASERNSLFNRSLDWVTQRLSR